MRILTSLIIVIVSLISCKSMNYIKYHNCVNEAEYSFFNSDYETASYLYGKAFRKVKIPFENDIFFYAASLWQNGDSIASIGLLDTLVHTRFALTQSGYFESMSIAMRDSILAKNDPIVDSIWQARRAHPTKHTLDSIFKLDGLVRNTVSEYAKEFPNDTIEINRLYEEMDNQDSMNLIIMDSLNFIGGVHFPAHPFIMGNLLIHQTEWVSENKKELKKAIKDGRLLPAYYACPFDYYLVIIGDSSVHYGQWSDLLEGVRPETVFKRSKKMGVSPYYKKYAGMPKKKGLEPKKHLYYEYYKERKSSFTCY